MNFDHHVVVILFGGVAFLIFGLSLMSEALQRLAANQIRDIFNRLKSNSIIGVIIGAALTVMMQSSGAVTATLVNLGSARVLTLNQVMGVLLGAAIGSTITVQLISLNISVWGLPTFIIGFFFQFLARNRRVRESFEFVMGLGLVFFGIEVIGWGAQGLTESTVFVEALGYMKSHAGWYIVIAMITSSLFQSSTATLGIVMGLLAGNMISVSEAIMWVYGANIGASSTGLVASLKADYIGRRIAWANFLFRTATVVVFIPFADTCMSILEAYNLTPSVKIATFYMAMNVFAASVFFPLRGLGVRMIEKVVQPSEREQEFGVRFLKRSSYESFSMALAHAKREILEMGDIVYQMLERSLDLFKAQDPETSARIRAADDKVDLLLREIKLFLIRVSNMAPEGLSQSVIDLISFGSDIEGAADIIDHHLRSLAEKKHKHKLEFSPEVWRELEQMHEGAMQAMSTILICFQTEDPVLAERLIQIKHDERDKENQFRQNHILRLTKQGENDSLGTSALYIETLNTYTQLVEMLARHAQRLRRSQQSGGSDGPKPRDSSN